MRQCSTCNQSKEDHFFNWKIKEVKRSSVCKSCHKLYRQNHYLQNKDKYISMAKARYLVNGKYCSPQQIYAYEYLLHHPCVDCGEINPALLQYDHRDLASKNFSISQGVRLQKTLTEIIKEIALCDIRCVSCHTLRTSKQFNWYRWYDQLDTKFKNVYKPPVDLV